MKGCLYSFTYFLALLVAVPASLFSTKVRRGFWGRFGLSRRVRKFRKDDSRQLFWFHVASSGEFEQCLAILDEIKQLRPQARVFLSYFSPTAKVAVELETQRRISSGHGLSWDFADYSPFDFRFCVKRFLKALRPSHFIAIHREIWPALLEECRKQNVHRLLLGMYLPPQSRASMRRLSSWLGYFEHIGTTEKETANFLTALLPRTVPISVTGDPRIERVLKRKAMQKPPPWKGFFPSKVIILASLWPEDFGQVSDGLIRLLVLNEGWRIVLAPHEPKEAFVTECQKWFTTNAVPGRRWSHWVKSPDLSSHLVVDGVGWLAELYQVATLVFVGGSFHRRVHNVLEPAAYGKPMLTGPYIENSGEAMELWRDNKGLIRVTTPADFSETLLRLATDSHERDCLSVKLGEYLLQRQGASGRCAQLVVDF